MHKILALSALACACVSVNATTIVGTTGYSGSLSFQANQYVAQPFAVTGAATLDSVVFNFSKVGTFDCFLQLTDALGGSPSVLYSAPFTIADGPVTIPLNSTAINSGLYFFVLSTGTLDFNARVLAGSSLLEPFGAVGGAMFSGSQNATNPEQSPFLDSGSTLLFNLEGEFSGIHDADLAHQLLGTNPTSDVPESSNTLPLCAGAMLILAAGRRFI
jgi:hypothetical protein